VVRQNQRRSSLIITDWAVQPLSDKGIINSGGLWALDGHARDAHGTYAWSLVIKVLRRPQRELSPSDPWYWKREVDFAQSCFPSRLPESIRAPRFYRVDKHRDAVWLLMQRVRQSSSEAWTPDDFRRTAHDLGRWNGACLTQFGRPTEPWLPRHHYLTVMKDSTAEDWAFPLNQKYLSPSLRTVTRSSLPSASGSHTRSMCSRTHLAIWTPSTATCFCAREPQGSLKSSSLIGPTAVSHRLARS
jgi:hypothetical protein